MNTENNKIIAEFLGIEKFKDLLATLHKGKISIDVDVYKQAKFDNDWNWLMEVVEKIRVIDQTANGDFKRNLLHFQRNNKNIFDTSILEGKEYVYKLVLEFIKWYNQQPK